MNRYLDIALLASAMLVWTGIARADDAPAGPHGTHDAASAAWISSHGYPVLLCQAPPGGGVATCAVRYVKH